MQVAGRYGYVYLGIQRPEVDYTTYYILYIPDAQVPDTYMIHFVSAPGLLIPSDLPSNYNYHLNVSMCNVLLQRKSSIERIFPYRHRYGIVNAYLPRNTLMIVIPLVDSACQQYFTVINYIWLGIVIFKASGPSQISLLLGLYYVNNQPLLPEHQGNQ